MKKHVAAVCLVDRDEATEAVELPEELCLSLGAIAGVAREGLLAMCTTVGLAVMGEMMTAEMTAKVGGPKHAKLAQRQGNWHGSAPGSVVLGGRRIPVERPRGRAVAGDEIELATYAAFSNDDLLSQVVMERMLADPAKGERACRDLAAASGQARPDAAASLREGLEDMLTVRRLGVGGRLAASLTNTNCIQSMISIARDTTKNVKRWRDGKIIKRWCAAGMLNAGRRFRRLKGYRQIPTLVAALAVTSKLLHRHAMLHQSHERTG
jgi:hypothetical protein